MEGAVAPNDEMGLNYGRKYERMKTQSTQLNNGKKQLNSYIIKDLSSEPQFYSSRESICAEENEIKSHDSYMNASQAVEEERSRISHDISFSPVNSVVSDKKDIVCQNVCGGTSTAAPSSTQMEESNDTHGEEEMFYKHHTEEVAWRLYNKLNYFKSDIDEEDFDKDTNKTNKLAEGIGNENIQYLPLPKSHPFDTKSFPSSGRWSFDEETRVLLGDFRGSKCDNRGKFIPAEDERFLFEMMERDDIVVVTDGWASNLNEELWNCDFLKGTVGDHVFHRFRVFQRTFVLDKSKSHVPALVDCGRLQQEWIVQYKEAGHSMTLHMKDYLRYLNQRKEQLDLLAMRREESGFDPINPSTPEEEKIYRMHNSSQSAQSAESEQITEIGQISGELFIYKDQKGSEQSFNCVDIVLYLIDYDMVKLLPKLNDDFSKNFMCPELLPGGEVCMMHEVNTGGRPFMGPNLYVTPPASFTHFHQDGHGTVDSGHQCLSGYNEVIMLRRLTEQHKKHAIYLLNGKDPTYYDALYGLPHADGLKDMPHWPRTEDIEECREMNYYPAVFVLKPGQWVHINKGRLHAFRKLAPLRLSRDDCHFNLREAVLQRSAGKPISETLCVSVAWDWMYRGATPDGINREVSTMLECASLNRLHGAQSLAIPETSILQTATTMLTRVTQTSHGKNKSLSLLGFKEAIHGNQMECSCPSPNSILKGLLPSLEHVVRRHKSAADTALQTKANSVAVVLFAKHPDSWENPQIFSVDPFGNDFFCKLCSEELSNIYMHCDGCEKILNKDFNICVNCHAEERYRAFIQMHPNNPKSHSTLNHTGKYHQSRQSRCPCKNGPVCKLCGYCAGCSCRCHKRFTLRHRIMKTKAEETLLQRVKEVVGDGCVRFASETRRRLENARPLPGLNNELSLKTEIGNISEPKVEVKSRNFSQSKSKEDDDFHWSRMITRLGLFKAEHGNIEVPYRYLGDEQPSLGKWVSRMQIALNDHHFKAKRARSLLLSDKRAHALLCAGFEVKISKCNVVSEIPPVPKKRGPKVKKAKPKLLPLENNATLPDRANALLCAGFKVKISNYNDSSERPPVPKKRGRKPKQLPLENDATLPHGEPSPKKKRPPFRWSEELSYLLIEGYKTIPKDWLTLASVLGNGVTNEMCRSRINLLKQHGKVNEVNPWDVLDLKKLQLLYNAFGEDWDTLSQQMNNKYSSFQCQLKIRSSNRVHHRLKEQN